MAVGSIAGAVSGVMEMASVFSHLEVGENAATLEDSATLSFGWQAAKAKW